MGLSFRKHDRSNNSGAGFVRDVCNERQGKAASAVRARSSQTSRKCDDGDSRLQYRTLGRRAARAGGLADKCERSVGWPAFRGCSDGPMTFLSLDWGVEAWEEHHHDNIVLVNTVSLGGCTLSRRHPE